MAAGASDGVLRELPLRGVRQEEAGEDDRDADGQGRSERSLIVSECFEHGLGEITMVPTAISTLAAAGPGCPTGASLLPATGAPRSRALRR